MLVQQKIKNNNYKDPLFDRKVDLVTAGLRTRYARILKNELSYDNALIICNYITSMKTEVNLSDNYRRMNIDILGQLSKFYDNQKPFNQITREDVLSYLDSLRKPETLDPLHKWVGTYNLYGTQLKRFFKWLYYPDIEPSKRPKPNIMENIPTLRRKEKSIYKPSDLWTPEEDLIFLRYCPSIRMKCYHAVARDLGCRPHEILKLKIRDIVFKVVAGGEEGGIAQYAQVAINGKTGTRTLPLIDSLPYVKDYLDHEHPQSGNPNAIFICGTGKSLGRSIRPESLNHIYARYKTDFFPKLLEFPNVPPEDKQRIRELLKKPWAPYLIGRHTSLTQKSRILKESTLRIFSGWTNNSSMPQRYLHFFGNEACESILAACGILPKGQQMSNLMKGRQCPNCNYSANKHDSKFCAKCRMVLTYDAYSKTVEDKQAKDDAITTLTDQVTKLMVEVQELKRYRAHAMAAFSSP